MILVDQWLIAILIIEFNVNDDGILTWPIRGSVRGLHPAAPPQKKKKILRPAASKVMILWLRHHQESQVAFYIDSKI